MGFWGAKLNFAEMAKEKVFNEHLKTGFGQYFEAKTLVQLASTS
jgi:hypothetical protein